MEHTFCTTLVCSLPILEFDCVAVMAVPVSCVSQGGFEQTCWMAPDTDEVSVVPASLVSLGELEQAGTSVEEMEAWFLLELCTVPVWSEPMLERAVVEVLVVPVRRFSCCLLVLGPALLSETGVAGSEPESEDGVVLLFTVSISLDPMSELAVVAVLVVPVSWVSEGVLVHTCCAMPMFAEAVVAVLVVPVTCVSQGGLEQIWSVPILAEAVVAVLVVPVSWVSHGGLEQTSVTVVAPSPSPASAPVVEGCSEVGEARMETGRSCAGWASASLGVVIRVT